MSDVTESVTLREAAPDASSLKQCCAQLYESDVARWLLGDSLHPGGLRLTKELGTQLQLTAADRVLDVASGAGSSALFLAEHFGCEVVGIDYGRANVQQSNAEAAARGLGQRAYFREGDAESLPFGDDAFDALICECAYCTFPDKARAAGEFARVLNSHGRLGLSDLTRAPQLSGQLEDLLAWIACIAAAQPAARYLEQLQTAGFSVQTIATHDQALQDLVRQVRGRLLTVELMSGLKKLELTGIDLQAAKRMVQEAEAAIERGELGYVLIAAAKRR